MNLPVNVLPVTFPGHGHSQAFNAPDDLPKTLIRNLNQGSSPMSMDFHPVQQTLLLGLPLLELIFLIQGFSLLPHMVLRRFLFFFSCLVD